MNRQKDYQSLLEKYLSNQCTPAEAEELFNYLQKDEAGRLLLKSLQQNFDKDDFEQRAVIDPNVSDAVWRRLEKGIEQQEIKKQYPFKRWVAVAAAAVVLFTAGWFLYLRNKPSTSNYLVSQKERYKNDVLPGGNKAVLTLGNGTKIVLNQSKNGFVSKQGQTVINKLNDSLLSYRASAQNGGIVSYNTISTPRGGQYQVILPDGTEVWLNAASSLRFPTAFTGRERNVELTGEAYFEVKKNKAMRFKVTANKVQVEVRGTHFNVNAYNDETTLKTTLIEGSVKLSSGAKQVMLVPGQQGSFSTGAGNFNVAQVDTEEAVAWKNGNFNFASEDLRTILRKVSRWYDVDIVYQDNVSKKAIWGSVSRFDKVSEVLKTIELTGVAHFEISGRRIIVMK